MAKFRDVDKYYGYCKHSNNKNKSGSVLSAFSFSLHHLHTVIDQYRTFLSLLCFACSGRTQYINNVHALDTYAAST